MAKQTEFLPLPWEQAKGAQFKEVSGPLFANHGGNELAARRAAGLCPTCGKVKLSAYERRNGYQCPSCTARDEGTGY